MRVARSGFGLFLALGMLAAGCGTASSSSGGGYYYPTQDAVASDVGGATSGSDATAGGTSDGSSASDVKVVTVCGDGTCDASETKATCPADCGGSPGGADATTANDTATDAATGGSDGGGAGASDTSTGSKDTGSATDTTGGGTGGAHYCDNHCTKDKQPGECYCDDQCAKIGDCCMADGSKSAQKNSACTGSTCGLCNGSAPPANQCGNGVCDQGEDSTSCVKDCPAVPPGTNFCDVYCGKQAPSGCYCDNKCAEFGDCCLADGKAPTKEAPNKACTGSNCAQCNGSTPAATCGNGKCETGETATSCPADCGSGGGGTCTTYADVQSILKTACGKCHGFGGGCSAASNFSLIATRVANGSMPPKSEPQLNAADKAKIAAWAQAKGACTSAQCP